MNLSLKWGTSGPILQKPGTCASCGLPFACELTVSGCWCSKVALTDAARAEIRAKYEGCLCPVCLKQYEGASRT